MTTTIPIKYFRSLRLARAYVGVAFRTAGRQYRIFMGDGEYFWVVATADGEQLLKDGYEEVLAAEAQAAGVN